MFRLFVLSVVILAGCGSKTSSEPRAIKVFDNIPSFKTKALEHPDCNWEEVELSIFNQSSQVIKFEYQNCPHEGETRFTVKNGNEIFGHSENGELHILSIWKTGFQSEEKFLKSLIPEEDDRKSCKFIQNEQKHWKIGIDENTEAGSVLYPSLTEGCLTYYGFDIGNSWHFKFKDGIAVGYLELLNKLSFYDLNSITYESRK